MDLHEQMNMPPLVVKFSFGPKRAETDLDIMVFSVVLKWNTMDMNLGVDV